MLLNSTSRIVVASLAAFSTAILFVIQQSLININPGVQSLPIRFVGLTAGFLPPSSYGIALLALAGLQMASLYVLYQSLRKEPAAAGLATPAIIAAAAIMAWTSLRAPTVTSGDAYLYIGYAKFDQPKAAYDPPATAFSGDFAIINQNWHVPIEPCLYGPLWVAVSHAVVSPMPTLLSSFYALRVLNLALFLALLLSFRALGASAPLLSIIGLNPAVYNLFIVNAHNDMLALVLLIAGAAVAKRYAQFGAIIAALAALVKLPLVCLAILAFRDGSTVRQRLVHGAVVIVVVAIGSLAFGGQPYIHAMTADVVTAAHKPSDTWHTIGYVLRLLAVLYAFVAMGAAIFKDRWWASAAYAFSALRGAVIWPWYLAWSIPYAARVQTFTGVFFFTLPFVSRFCDTSFPWLARPWATVDILLIVLFAFAARELFGDRRPTVSDSDQGLAQC